MERAGHKFLDALCSKEAMAVLKTNFKGVSISTAKTVIKMVLQESAKAVMGVPERCFQNSSCPVDFGRVVSGCAPKTATKLGFHGPLAERSRSWALALAILI
jgi:hypothetical protein